MISRYRPQTKFAKVMFSQVSVSPQGGCVSQHALDRHTPPWDQRQTPLPPGPEADTPWQIRDTVNKWAVRIPLECILVFIMR